MNLNKKSCSRRKELKDELQLNADPTHSRHSQSLSEPSSLRLVRTQRRRQKKEIKQEKENITKIKHVLVRDRADSSATGKDRHRR